MKILYYIPIICFLLVNSTLNAQEKYRSHTVKNGETITSISKVYGISESEIIRLNPEVRNGVSAFNVLILPVDDVINATSQEIKFKKHRVKRRETLFSIAKKYNVSVDDIKKFNKHLYSKELKKGEKIQIPINLKQVVTEVVDPNNNENGTTSEASKHTVSAKETKYGIARKYGVTIAELEELNPNIKEGLKIGDVLKVPNTSTTGSSVIEEELYEFYEVQPKEGFFRLKVKLGLSKDEIIRLNPYAKDGLKDGMILKIPKKNGEVNSEISNVINLEDGIVNRSKKKLVVMLPFQLQKVASDSLDSDKDLLKGNRTLRVALDFYSGVLMATEFAKDKGISLEVDVLDTQASDSKVTSLISNKDFSNVDAVIGPLLEKNVIKATQLLKKTDTPIFSPLSNREMKISSNLFQTLPTDAMLEKAMINFINDNSEGKNIILVSDSKRSAQKAKIISALPGTKTISLRKGAYIYVNDIQAKVDNTKENWVILESTDPVLVSNVVGLLNGMPDEAKLRLFTLDKGKVYDFHDISNFHLAKLGFTFPSINKSYNYKEPNAFVTSYKNKYGVLPNRYAVRGFDVTYDVILRLASADDVYDATNNDFVTEYIENKFHYSKKLFSGYQNNAFYIVKYDENLQLEVIK
ncbi:MAG: LysM peptidoglycan-binding domain-containing protein [Flavobacteriaceae bacterium]|nr:LysM peptidoglycan-binding domain-containing protein [Flavobacteriaceae bacterium]